MMPINFRLLGENQKKLFSRQSIPESSCTRKETWEWWQKSQATYLNNE